MKCARLLLISTIILMSPSIAMADTCVAKASVSIGDNVTSEWRQLVVDVSSADCQKLACSGAIDIRIVPKKADTPDSDTPQLSLPFTIQLSHASEHFKTTRRVSTGRDYDKLDRVIVENVSCQNP
jgi:hypothetical protein